MGLLGLGESLAGLGVDAGALEELLVDVLGLHDVADEAVAEEDVVVHRIGDNLGDLGVGEADEGVVLRVAGLLVPGQSQLLDLAELLEELLHLVLEEAVGDAAEVDDVGLDLWF